MSNKACEAIDDRAELQDPERIEFENVDITDVKCVERPSFRLRRSTLFVTIADPQITLVDVEKIMETGMNVARFKTSHCTKGDKIKLIHKVDKAAAFLARKHGMVDWPCATCVELKTCIIQTGLLEEEVPYVNIKPDTEITLTYDLTLYNKCNNKRIFVDNPYLTSDVKVGMEVNIGQEEIIMKCTAILNDKAVKCTVTKGGRLKGLAYMCMRGAKRTRPYITKKDLNLVKFAVEYQVDVIIINYVRHVDTLKKIRKYLGQNIRRPAIIAGVCTQEGLGNVDDVIREADGIMLSRQLLTYEVEPALCNRMHLIQSFVAGKCLQAGKPFYICGDVFPEALATGVFCVRDIADVTNAVIQGAAGFVLSESQNIEYTVEVMKAINELCASVETISNDKNNFWSSMHHIKMPMNAAEASACSCVLIANQTNARVLIIPTVTGRTVSLLQLLRPISIIIAISTRIRSTRLLKTYRNVIPLLYKGSARRTWYSTVQARVQYAIEYAVEKHWVLYGDFYVTLEKGTEESSFCDCVRVWKVTTTKKNIMECPESYRDFKVNCYETETKKERKKSCDRKATKDKTKKQYEGETIKNTEEQSRKNTGADESSRNIEENDHRNINDQHLDEDNVPL